MNHFRVFYTDGTHYDTEANSNRQEFEDYLKQAPHVTENFETGAEVRRYVSSVAQIMDHTESEPERDFYSIFTNRDGSLHWYLTTMQEHMKYKALYGSRTGKWSYEVQS